MSSRHLPVEDPFVQILRNQSLGTVLLVREQCPSSPSTIEWIARSTSTFLHDWEHGATIAFRTSAWSIGPVTVLTITTKIRGARHQAWFTTNVNLFSPDLMGPKLLGDLAIQPDLPIVLYAFSPQVQLTVSISNPLQQFARASLHLAKSFSTPWLPRTFAKAAALLRSMYPTPYDLWKASGNSSHPPTQPCSAKS